MRRGDDGTGAAQRWWLGACDALKAEGRWCGEVVAGDSGTEGGGVGKVTKGRRPFSAGENGIAKRGKRKFRRNFRIGQVFIFKQKSFL